MRITVFTLHIVLVVCLCIWISGQSCNQATPTDHKADSLAIRKSIAHAPVLSPQQSITKMHLEEGFTVQLVAAEPLVVAPVALTFDEKGRIWVIEMTGYMPDTLGAGEEQPTGKIVILSDKNGDGVMDERKVFLDSLVLPRAICLIENGILVAEPPRLWHYDIVNDRPVNKTLVDEKYAEGGNVEHQPNGLFRAIDNWIYNAKSNKRYKKKAGKWLIEKTHFRGQWGITQDDYGRLFYNHNSANLLGDYFLPGLGAGNEHQKNVAGFDETIVEDKRVYPVRPTPGINRGYLEDMLDDSLRLVQFTAACGPVIYSGHLFDPAYYGNAFVAEPSANLIKRNILRQKGFVVDGQQAYTGKEFLASEDERFRPVSLYNAPDGALYVVDMYRGIIQHKTYLTPYLKNEIRERSLSQPLNCGRIYRVIPKNKPAVGIRLPNAPEQLPQLLEHRNGWVRSKAQALIVDGKLIQTAPVLRQYLQTSNEPVTIIHALWTLEGLELLQWSDVQPLLKHNHFFVRMHALSVLPAVISPANVDVVLSTLYPIIQSGDTLSAPLIGFIVPSIKKINSRTADKIIDSLTKYYRHNIYAADAIISNLHNREASFYQRLLKWYPDTTQAIHKRLKKVLEDMAKAKNNSRAGALEKQFPRGAAMYRSVCATCHGADGNGIAKLAPPLNQSEWVTGDKNKLISIVLYGMTGPVPVKGKLYRAPEISGDMPGIGQNDEFSDADIAQVLSLIRKSWNNNADAITVEDVQRVRQQLRGRDKPFTAEELKKKK